MNNTKFSLEGNELLFHDEELGKEFLTEVEKVKTSCDELCQNLAKILDNKINVKLTLSLNSKEE